jgi:hypothetical protein
MIPRLLCIPEECRQRAPIAPEQKRGLLVGMNDEKRGGKRVPRSSNSKENKKKEEEVYLLATVGIGVVRVFVFQSISHFSLSRKGSNDVCGRAFVKAAGEKFIPLGFG